MRLKLCAEESTGQGLRIDDTQHALAIAGQQNVPSVRHRELVDVRAALNAKLAWAVTPCQAPARRCPPRHPAVRPIAALVRRGRNKAERQNAPCRSLKPLTGMRDVPVLNCSSRIFFSASMLLIHWDRRKPSATPFHHAGFSNDGRRVGRLGRGAAGWAAGPGRGGSGGWGGSAGTHLPKPDDDLVVLVVVAIDRVPTPVLDVDLRDAANQQLAWQPWPSTPAVSLWPLAAHTTPLVAHRRTSSSRSSKMLNIDCGMISNRPVLNSLSCFSTRFSMRKLITRLTMGIAPTARRLV